MIISVQKHVSDILLSCMRESPNSNSPAYWDKIVDRMDGRYHIDDILCLHKKITHLDLIARWVDMNRVKRLLKTDLFEEALGTDQFLFDLAGPNRKLVGMDISPKVAARARERSRQLCTGNVECICCDARKLPFGQDSFDLVISNSTLDHYSNKEDISVALAELWRVLEPGGTLILTLDNKSNWTEPFFRLWIRCGLSPYFSGRTLSIKEAKGTLQRIGFDVTDSTAIIHNPRLITRTTVGLINKIQPAKSAGIVKRGLNLFDSLETRRTKYLTGLYIALRAVKRTGGAGL